MATMKTYNGSSWVRQLVGGQGPVGEIGLTGNQGADGARGSVGVDSALYSRFIKNTRIRAMTYDPVLNNGSSTLTFATNLSMRYPIFLPKPVTLTGMVVAIATPGDFTAATGNFVSMSTGAPLNTAVAQSAEDPNIWKQTAGSAMLVPFTTPYAAAAGLYWLHYEYEYSAVVSDPILPAASTNAAISSGLKSAVGVNNAFLYSGQVVPWMAVYE